MGGPTMPRSLARPDAHRARVEALAGHVLSDLDQRCALLACPILMARDALGDSPLAAYGTDRHLNAVGNGLVAEALALVLAQEGPARRPTGRALVAEEGEVGDPSL